jgi:hypothetical protein
MRAARRVVLALVLLAATGLFAQQTSDSSQSLSDSDLLEKSREAGLLTDWHMDGHFGHHDSQFSHSYAPEKVATRSGAHHLEQRYELVFPEGVFALPKELAGERGVFYAVSSTYLGSSGEWNVYLDSRADATVFVDGKRAVTSRPNGEGVMRETLHLESGYHSVMVKFTAQGAPFSVAILPPNSGSRRKNNTPYLQASPASEDMQAIVAGESAPGF